MIGGSQTLTTDVGNAFRGWLILVTELSRQPVVLRLAEHTYANVEDREPALAAVETASRELLQRLQSLPEEQLRAVVQQATNDEPTRLVNRTIRYWSRPRLYGVDWLHCAPGRASYDVPKHMQDEDFDLPVGSQVMLAGDGFPDVHGTVAADSDKAWTITMHWDEWDR